MARIRSTHPGQWADGDFLECSAHARLLALALRNMADDNGVFRWKPKSIKAVCLPADNCDIDQLLDELVENEQIARFEIDGKAYGAIHNFCKYQKPRKPVSVHPLTEAISAYVGKPCDNSGSQAPQDDEQVPQQCDTSSAKVRTSTGIPDQREEGGGNRNGNSNELPNGASAGDFSDEFAEWYAACPRKQTRERAKRAYSAARKKTDARTLLEGIQRYAAWCRSSPPTETKFTQLPATWLNGGGWDDELAPKDGKPQPVKMDLPGVAITLRHPARPAWIRHWEAANQRGDPSVSLKLTWYSQDKTVREDTEYPPGTTPTTQPKEAAE